MDELHVYNGEDLLGRYQLHRFDAALAAYIDAQRLLPEGRTAQRARLLGDEALTLSFMARFEEVLGAYPRWDLSRDVIFATLVRPKQPAKPKAASTARPAPSFARRVARGVRRRVRQRLPR